MQTSGRSSKASNGVEKFDSFVATFVTFVRRDCYHSGNSTVTQRFEFRETDTSRKKDAELTPSEIGGDDPTADPVTRRMLPTLSLPKITITVYSI
jgi:hypothetical protein